MKNTHALVLGATGSEGRTCLPLLLLFVEMELRHLQNDMQIKFHYGFHGSDDKVVKPKHSLKMAKAIIASGGSPKMTLYENVGHDSWNNAFTEPNFLKWIHSKSKK